MCSKSGSSAGLFDEKNGTVLLKICLYIFCEQPDALHLEFLCGQCWSLTQASFWTGKREKERTENPIHFFNLCFQKVVAAVFGPRNDISVLAVFQYSYLATQGWVFWFGFVLCFFFPLVSQFEWCFGKSLLWVWCRAGAWSVLVAASQEACVLSDLRPAQEQLRNTRHRLPVAWNPGSWGLMCSKRLILPVPSGPVACSALETCDHMAAAQLCSPEAPCCLPVPRACFYWALAAQEWGESPVFAWCKPD